MIFVTIFCAGLAACVHLAPASLPPGIPADAVRARLGEPSHTYQDGEYTELEYAKGQYTFMARIDPQGKLASYEQVLTADKFATVAIGRADKASILHTFGQPAAMQRYPTSNTDAWLYHYKEQDIWNSIMYVEFYPTGKVKSLQSGPDPERESSRGR